MTKILCVGDIHLSDRSPLNATDSYTQDILDMLAWIADYEKEIDADAVVWLGDIFHFKQPSRTSHSLVLRTIEVAQKYRNLYVVVGNHDISNDRLESINEKQPLGVLFKSGHVKEINGWHPTLPLFGAPWHWRWTTDPEAVKEAFADWRAATDPAVGKKPTKSLAVTHAPIFPPGEEPPYDYLKASDVAWAMDQLGDIAYGHIHDYHGVYEVGGVRFSNLGAISRGSLTESNLTRPIKIALWTDLDGFEEIDVPHKPANEVFHIAEAEAKKEAKLSADQYLSEVGRSTLDISSTQSVIDHVKSMNVDSKVKKLAIEILEDVE